MANQSPRRDDGENRIVVDTPADRPSTISWDKVALGIGLLAAVGFGFLLASSWNSRPAEDATTSSTSTTRRADLSAVLIEAPEPVVISTALGELTWTRVHLDPATTWLYGVQGAGNQLIAEGTDGSWPAAFQSSDGRAWQSFPIPDLVLPQGRLVLTNSGLLALGRQRKTMPEGWVKQVPVVAHATQLMSWQEVPIEDLQDEVARPRWVVGTEGKRLVVGDASDQAVVWAESDGQYLLQPRPPFRIANIDRYDSEPLFFPINDGFAALAWPEDEPGPIEVWYSSDGSAWDLKGAPLAGFPIAAHEYGNRVVLVLVSLEAADYETWSTDDATDWTELEVPEFGMLPGPGLGVAVSAGGFGWAILRQADAGLWVSSDGLAWERLPDEVLAREDIPAWESLRFLNVAVTDDRIVVIGEHRPGFPEIDLGTFAWVGELTDS